eukprot:scaffold24602_cov26-Prasinocladus_malaysianus.AAC.1
MSTPSPAASSQLSHVQDEHFVLQLARAKGFEVEEGPLHVEEAMQSDEMFTSGTAVVVAPVGSLSHRVKPPRRGETKLFGEPGPVASDLYETLVGIQHEQREDQFGWIQPVC